jgi:hypothetical protein
MSASFIGFVLIPGNYLAYRLTVGSMDGGSAQVLYLQRQHTHASSGIRIHDPNGEAEGKYKP